MECQGYDIFLWQSKHKEIETKWEWKWCSSKE
jgi:hypothetical protein